MQILCQTERPGLNFVIAEVLPLPALGLNGVLEGYGKGFELMAEPGIKLSYSGEQYGYPPVSQIVIHDDDALVGQFEPFRAVLMPPVDYIGENHISRATQIVNEGFTIGPVKREVLCVCHMSFLIGYTYMYP